LSLTNWVRAVLIASVLVNGPSYAQKTGETGIIPQAPDGIGLLLTLIKPVSTDEYAKFDTLVEAGSYGVSRAYQCSRNYECSGTINKSPEGKFVVFPVHTDYQSDHVSIPDDTPEGWEHIADYHTHPCIAGYATEVFSPSDLITNIIAQTVGFMGDLCTGKIHMFDPAIDKPNTKKMVEGVWLTEGRIVGQLKLTEPIKVIADEGP
jgi:hypothetical protein